MQTLIKTAVFGFVLMLGACDSSKDPVTVKGDKHPAKTPVTDPVEAKVEQPEVPALDPKVEQAVSVANKISAKPEAADSILEEAGMDRETFERLLYEIARDPELSKSYAVAREA